MDERDSTSRGLTAGFHSMAGMSSTRRGILSAAAVSATGLAVTACGGDAARAPERGSARARDIEIVNYALRIEYLEAHIYERALESKAFSGDERDMIERFLSHEQQHIDALTAAAGKLGGIPIEEPEPEFEAADRIAFLKLAQRVENLGAAAYLGQAHRIEDAEILAAVLSIHSVEARHSAALNTILDKDIAPTGAFAKPVTIADARPVVDLFLAP